MYSLPLEYWDEKTLRDIGNGLGVFIKVAKETRLRRYTSYARICVQMLLVKALTDSVSLFHDDFEWIRTIDYEHVPFRCRKCHEHGYLFRDCPLNSQTKAPDSEASKDADGFTKVTSRRKHAKKSPVVHDPPRKPSTHNSFGILSPQNDLVRIPSHPSSSDRPSTSISPPPNSSTPISASDLVKIPASPSSDNTIPDPGPKATTMDLDAASALTIHQNQNRADQNLPIHMEEEPESIELGDLDILGLETTC